MTDKKLDIFAILAALDRKDVDFYSNLTPAEQKTIQPFVLMRWLTGTYNKRQVFLINELINPYVFSMNDHKDLLWKMLTMCTTGKPQRYVWNKPGARGSASPTAIKIIQQYFGYNSRDSAQTLKLLSHDDVILMAEELGWQDDEINKVRKEFDMPLLKVAKARKKTTKVTNLDLIEF